jgi:hypothetical protein
MGEVWRGMEQLQEYKWSLIWIEKQFGILLTPAKNR